MKHDYPALQKILGQVGVGAIIAGFIEGVFGEGNFALTALIFYIGVICIYLAILRK